MALFLRTDHLFTCSANVGQILSCCLDPRLSNKASDVGIYPSVGDLNF